MKTLEDFLSPDALAAETLAFHQREADHERHVAETTAKRRANNKALFGDPA